jgi:hypothetical protein
VEGHRQHVLLATLGNRWWEDERGGPCNICVTTAVKWALLWSRPVFH